MINRVWNEKKLSCKTNMHIPGILTVLLGKQKIPCDNEHATETLWSLADNS